ncbi:hypothetical protein [Labilithrix luteola]|uniref:hypothetical protein n=1 Tax=Labilithrix luteola TaxID=1391654 RepID=UPI0011BA643F|nr:hypothetical protein [Labilithrix luteola]
MKIRWTVALLVVGCGVSPDADDPSPVDGVDGVDGGIPSTDAGPTSTPDAGTEPEPSLPPCALDGGVGDAGLDCSAPSSCDQVTPVRDNAGVVVCDFWAALPKARWIELRGTHFMELAAPLIPPGKYLGNEKISAIVDAYSDPTYDEKREKAFFYGGGHNDGTVNALVEFDLRRLTYALTIPPTPPIYYPPSYAAGNGGGGPGPLVYPSGAAPGYFSSTLTDPLDLPYKAPQDAPGTTHIYGSSAMGSDGLIRYFYAQYREVDVVAKKWSHLGDVDLGAQLDALDYSHEPLQQGTMAVYDAVTNRYFVTLVPGDAGINKRHALIRFDPVTRKIEQPVIPVPTGSSMDLLIVGRKIYGFGSGQGYPNTDTSAGFAYDIDNGTVDRVLVVGDTYTIASSNTQEAAPSFYHPGLGKIVRWNYGASVSSVYLLDLTPSGGAGTAADPHKLQQTKISVAGKPPNPVLNYRRLFFDTDIGVALVLPQSNSNWFALKL